MPDQPNPQLEDEDVVQTEILQQALILYPAMLTVEETIRDLIGASRNFKERNSAENAIRDLIRAGLLHRHGDFLVPTRAAARFNELRW